MQRETENKQVILLGRNSAKELDVQIVRSAEHMRSCLYEMYIGEGWRALGFASWQAYLEDVAERAKLTPKTLRKHTRAALLESGAGKPIGTFSEGSIRPISDVLSARKGFDEEQRTDALELAIEWAGGDKDVTAQISRRAAYYVMVDSCEFNRLAERMRIGDISPEKAVKIMHMLKQTNSDTLFLILQEVSDVALASSLFNLTVGESEVGAEIIETIVATGHVPGPHGSQVPLGDARNSHLLGHLHEPKVIENAEKMAAKRSEMMEICAAARQVILHVFDGKEPDITEYPYHNFMYQSLVEAGML